MDGSIITQTRILSSQEVSTTRKQFESTPNLITGESFLDLLDKIDGVIYNG